MCVKTNKNCKMWPHTMGKRIYDITAQSNTTRDFVQDKSILDECSIVPSLDIVLLLYKDMRKGLVLSNRLWVVNMAEITIICRGNVNFFLQYR